MSGPWEFLMRYRLLFPVMPILVAGLSACTSTINAPSLAIRPQEEASALDAARPAEVAPALPPAVIALDGATMTRLEASLLAARTSKATFARASEPALAAVAAAAGAAPASESWIAAQLAISRLERARDATANARAEVDAVRRGLVAGGGNYDRAALALIEDEVAAIDNDQREMVQRLIGKLSRR
jgi:hypothetical protein